MNSIKITKELAEEYTELLIFLYSNNLDKNSLLKHMDEKTEIGTKVLNFLSKLGGDEKQEKEDFIELVFGSKFVDE